MQPNDDAVSPPPPQSGLVKRILLVVIISLLVVAALSWSSPQSLSTTTTTSTNIDAATSSFTTSSPESKSIASISISSTSSSSIAWKKMDAGRNVVDRCEKAPAGEAPLPPLTEQQRKRGRWCLPKQSNTDFAAVRVYSPGAKHSSGNALDSDCVATEQHLFTASKRHLQWLAGSGRSPVSSCLASLSAAASSSSSSSSSPSNSSSKKRIAIVASVQSNRPAQRGSQNRARGPAEMAPLIVTFLEHARPETDELHILVSGGGEVSFAQWQQLLRVVEGTVASGFCRLNSSSGETSSSSSNYSASDSFPIRPFCQRFASERLAKIVLVNATGWYENHFPQNSRRRVSAPWPTNLRVYLLEHYFENVLPSSHHQSTTGTILSVDAFDVIFQDNIFDAIEKLKLAEFDSSSNNADDHLILGAEEMSFYTRRDVNVLWANALMDPKVYVFPNSSGLPVEKVILGKRRSFPFLGNEPWPIFNSGVVGGTVSAMRAWWKLQRQILDCGGAKSDLSGIDQGAAIYSLFFGAHNAAFPYSIFALRPTVGPVRHLSFPTAESFVVNEQGQFTNCLGSLSALVHMLNRYPGPWASTMKRNRAVLAAWYREAGVAAPWLRG